MSNKAAREIPYKKTHIPSRLLGVAEVYHVIFVIYIIGYSILQYTLNVSDRDEFYDLNYEALVYLFSYSMLTFFLILKAAATYSVYEYYVALFILFQKLIVISITLFKKHVLDYTIQLAALIVICALNYVEFAYLTFNLFSRRREINLYLFKLSGVDPSVNNAFAIRKMLEVLGYANTFVSFFFLFSFTFHIDLRGIGVHIALRAAYFGLYIATCFFTYVCIEKEIRWQRIVALVLNTAAIAYLPIYIMIVVCYPETVHFNNQ